MGLKLEIITEHGVSVEYWRINKIHLRYELSDETGLELAEKAYITMEGYITKAAKDAGNRPLLERSITVKPVPQIAENTTEIRAVFYPVVKATKGGDPDWTKATDVLKEVKS